MSLTLCDEVHHERYAARESLLDSLRQATVAVSGDLQKACSRSLVDSIRPRVKFGLCPCFTNISRGERASWARQCETVIRHHGSVRWPHSW